MSPHLWDQAGGSFAEACRMFADGKTHLRVAADLDYPANITLAWQQRWLREREGTKVSTDHSHYFKPCPYDTVDVYRVLTLFAVTDPCIQHAVKKLLVAGGRGGGKPIDKDIQEAIESLVRWQGMRREEGGTP